MVTWSKREILRLFFDGATQEQELGRVHAWALWQLGQRWLGEGTDLVICETPLLHPGRFKAPIKFVVPSWVDQTISLPESPDEIRPGKRKWSYIKRCLNEGYVFEFTRSQAKFDSFFDELYVPYVSARYGERTMITPRQDLNRIFGRGGQFLMTLNQTPVAGRVAYVNDGTLFANEFGVSREGPGYWKQGGISTLDWQTILWAYDHNLTAFNFGGTRSWHSDGVFRYKSRWGAKTKKRSRIYSVLTIMAKVLSPQLRNRINQIGFISEVGDRFYGVYITDQMSDHDSSHADNVSPDSDLASNLVLVKNWGLDGLLVVSPSCRFTVHDMPRTSER